MKDVIHPYLSLATVDWPTGQISGLPPDPLLKSKTFSGSVETLSTSRPRARAKGPLATDGGGAWHRLFSARLDISGQGSLFLGLPQNGLQPRGV